MFRENLFRRNWINGRLIKELRRVQGVNVNTRKSLWIRAHRFERNIRLEGRNDSAKICIPCTDRSLNFSTVDSVSTARRINCNDDFRWRTAEGGGSWMIFKLDRRVNCPFRLLNEAESTVTDKHNDASKMKKGIMRSLIIGNVCNAKWIAGPQHRNGNITIEITGCRCEKISRSKLLFHIAAMEPRGRKLAIALFN